MVGGMISPAEPAMPMAPVRMRSISGPAPPPEIDEALIGQRAVVRLRAFNQPTTPELQATVSRIGAEVIREPQKSLTCDTIRLVLPASKIARIAPLAIVSGMKADVYFETYARSPWARLPRPVKDQFLKAFQER
jgi:HlyD family secretion protein